MYIHIAVVYVYGSLPGPLAQEKMIAVSALDLFSYTWCMRITYTEIRGVSARGKKSLQGQ